jgi:hypothetical protein
MSLATDATRDRGLGTTRVLDVAPEWMTLHEAAYAAKVAEGALLGWALAGRIEHRSLLRGDDPAGILVRTMDVRAMVTGLATSTTTSLPTMPERSQHELEARPSRGMNRRKVLVGLGAAALGVLVPVRALAGKPPVGRVLGARSLARARNRRTFDLLCEIERPDAIATSGAARATSGAAGATSAAIGGSASPAVNDPTTDGAAKGPGGDRTGSGGRALTISSVTVNPDPVAPGGSATIAIEASRKKNLSYSLTASEGVLIQDARRPWMWTWRDA